jgi:glutaredoxin
VVDYRNVYRSHEIMQEMLEVTRGQRDVPVIVEDGRVTIGHGGT